MKKIINIWLVVLLQVNLFSAQSTMQRARTLTKGPISRSVGSIFRQQQMPARTVRTLFTQLPQRSIVSQPSWWQRFFKWPSQELKAIYNDFKMLPERFRTYNTISKLNQIQPKVSQEFDSVFKNSLYDVTKQAYKKAQENGASRVLQSQLAQDYLASIKTARESMKQTLNFKNWFAQFTRNKNKILEAELWESFMMEQEPLLQKEQRILEEELLQLEQNVIKEQLNNNTKLYNKRLQEINEGIAQLNKPFNSPYGFSLIENELAGYENQLNVLKK